MIISFAGHSFVSNQEKIKSKLKTIIREIAVREIKVFCYCGGYGEFDNLCALASRELKKEGLNIEIVYVTPYLSLSQQRKINEMQKEKIYDGVVYPPIENSPPKFAISKRNQWMREQADVVIAYVKHEYDGAAQSLLYAKRKKKKIINLHE